MALGLYIHVPFCLARCDFCAFYLQVWREDRARRYVDALLGEIRLHADAGTLAGTPLDTVYFGGGTPTTLGADDLAALLEEVRARFGVSNDAEISIEAHPDTVTPQSLRLLAQAGFTRISVGMQSADRAELTEVGRPASSSLPTALVEAARAAGFANVNLDLMYGLPGQTMESWLRTLDAAVALEPVHVSCYALTVESGTALSRHVRVGTTQEPDPNLQNDLEMAASRRLARAGFERYEISNYCRPGFQCRHNLLYWEGADYLGLGPSAQSFLGGYRFGNVEHLSAYLERVGHKQLPIDQRETLDTEQRRREAVVFGLRRIQGVSRDLLTQCADAAWTARVQSLTAEGLLEESCGFVRLTDRGRRYADTVAVELI